jgi:hypothetical protein
MASTTAAKGAKRTRAAQLLATPLRVPRLSDGGVVMRPFHDGGRVRGPGTGTSDSIPAMLSHGEVVMPADTVRSVGAAKLLATIDATHVPTGRPPFKLGRAARADGGLADQDAATRLSTLPGAAVPPVAPVPAAPAFDPASGVGRPNALGSMADTMAQLATLQKSNADTSQAGFSGVLGATWKAPSLASPTPAPAPGGAAAALSNTAASPPGSITLLRPPRPTAPPAPGAAAASAAAAAATPSAAPPAVAKPPPAGSAFGLGAPSSTTAFGLGKPYTAMADGGLVEDPAKKAADDAALAARVASLPVAPMPTPAAAVTYEQPAPMQPMGADVQAALASGGAVSRNVATPTAAERLATVSEASGGAVFGVFPKPRSQFSTNANDAALQRGVVATSPTSFAPAPDASTLVPYTSPAGAGRGVVNPPDASLATPAPAANQAVARAIDNNPANAAAIAALNPVDNRTQNPNAPEPLVPTTPAKTDPNLPDGITRNGNTFSGSNVGVPSVNAAAQLSAVPQAALGSMADTERQLANLRASNADTSQRGFSGVLGGSTLGLSGDARQQFFDEANLRTAASRGSWSPRRGFQGDDTAVAAAMVPINARAALAQTTAKDMGDTQRALLAERGLDARSRLADTRAVTEIGINQQRLGLEGKKVALDSARDDRAAAAAAPKAAAEARKATLQSIIADPNSTSAQRQQAAQQVANMEGRELPAKGGLSDTQGKALQFGSRMLDSEGILSGLASAGVDQPGRVKRAADAVGIGGMANFTQSPQQQQVEQAQRNFINAALRRESGAAIADSEFANAKQQYFPQIGDSDQVKAQKKANREQATRGILAEVPDSEIRVAQVRGQPGQGGGSGNGSAQRVIARTGTHNGQRVVQYSDGSIDYAN